MKKSMAIRVLYFASLRDAMGRPEDILDAHQGATVADIWERVGGQPGDLAKLLCAVNMEYAALDAPVRDGDEVAFFPPVTGG